ncbi:MAG: hypothetical protein L6Q75_03710 [Burkholderiaceae bacterium]|nr:hypothetical protein [Burkholderiaceae bacterium]
MPALLDDPWPDRVFQSPDRDGDGCEPVPDMSSLAARVGGLLDGLVHDFGRGGEVLPWRLAEPAGCEVEAPPGSPSAGLFTPSLDLRDLLGGGGSALLDGLDLETALARALQAQGRADGEAERQPEGCQPSPAVESCAPAAADEGADAACGSRDAVALDLGWSAGGDGRSPLAGLLEPHRSGGADGGCA